MLYYLSAVSLILSSHRVLICLRSRILVLMHPHNDSGSFRPFHQSGVVVLHCSTERDRVTTWQVNKTHWRHSGHLCVDNLDCLLSLLCDQIRGWSEQPRCGLPTLTTTECDQVCPRHLLLLPMTISQCACVCITKELNDTYKQRIWQSRSRSGGEIIGTRCPECRRWVLFTCQVVTPSLSFCCFTEPSNLST